MKTNSSKPNSRLSRWTLFAGLLGLLWLPVFAQEEPESPIEEAMPAVATDAAVVASETPEAVPSRAGAKREAIVLIGKDAELSADETAEVVVVIGGNARINGKVLDTAVAIFGDLEIAGEIGDTAVAVMGNVKLLPGAKVNGEVVTVGGSIERGEDAEVLGQIQEVGFGAFGLPEPVWLKAWFKQCVLKLRPLAVQVPWVWLVAGIIFIVYLLVAVAFAQPVQTCSGELHQRPFTTFLLGLLAKLAVPILVGILAATGLGLIVVPFLLAAVALGLIIGKVAFLVFLGQALGRGFGSSINLKPLLAFLLGTVVLTLLYLVPVLGLITFGVSSVWGLGAVVSAMFSGFRRERNLPPNASPPIAPAGGPPIMNVTNSPAPSSTPFTPGMPPAASPLSASVDGASDAPPMEPAPPCSDAQASPLIETTTASMPDALLYPRASFWERIGAAFLDVILVSIIGSVVGGPPLGFLVALAYFSGMWAWKGTTIGGIVLGLKVARLDGGPVTFPVALVRGLAAAFSVVVLFLGFLWIAWDRDKQGWHDKIAGTVVVRQPRGQPLVCL